MCRRTKCVIRRRRSPHERPTDRRPQVHIDRVIETGHQLSDLPAEWERERDKGEQQCGQASGERETHSTIIRYDDTIYFHSWNGSVRTPILPRSAPRRSSLLSASSLCLRERVRCPYKPRVCGAGELNRCSTLSAHQILYSKHSTDSTLQIRLFLSTHLRTPALNQRSISMLL